MDYEGNPIDLASDSGGGGGIPTDISELELKTQNIDVTTTTLETKLNGNLTMSNIKKIDTNIVGTGQYGTGVLVNVIRPNLCLGATFIIHTEDGLGIDVNSLLIPVAAWHGLLGIGKRAALFRTNDKITPVYMTDLFYKQDCTITVDEFYRYALPKKWFLSDDNYILTCTADSRDGYMQRPIPFVYDPIVLQVDTNRSGSDANGLPTLYLLTLLNYASNDILWHCSFQYEKSIGDLSKLIVNDISLSSIPSVAQAIKDNTKLIQDSIPQYAYIDVYHQENTVTQQAIQQNVWLPAYHSLPSGHDICSVSTSSFYVPADVTYVDYKIQQSPTIGVYHFDTQLELSLVQSPISTIGISLDISLLDSNGDVTQDFDKKFHMVTYATSTFASVATYKYQSTMKVTISDPTVVKIRFQLYNIASAPINTYGLLVSLTNPLRLRVNRLDIPVSNTGADLGNVVFDPSNPIP